MKAMLLAAGRGERMRPLTLTTPKPLLPVLNRPLAAWVLDHLWRHGVHEVVANLYHLPREVERGLQEIAPRDMALSFSYEPELLGTAGALRHAAARLRGTGTVLALNSDTLTDLDVSALIRTHQASPALATLALVSHRPGDTPVWVDEAGRVAHFGAPSGPRPGAWSGPWTFAGWQVLDERLLEQIGDGPRDLVRDLYAPLLPSHDVGAYIHGGLWWEFGTPERYLGGQLELLAMDETSRSRVAPGVHCRQLGAATALIGEGAQLGGVTFAGGAIVGPFAEVGPASRLEDVILLPEAGLGEGCRLRRAVVGAGTALPTGFTVEDAVVCATPREGAMLAGPGVSERDGLLIRKLHRTAR